MFINSRSIKGRIFIWFFLCNSLLLFIIGLIIFAQVKFSVFKSVNNILRSKTDIIVNMLKVENKEIKIRLKEFVSGGYTIPESGHYYKVVINKNKFISSRSLRGIDFNLTNGKLDQENEEQNEKFYISTGPKGEPIRVLQKEIVFNGLPVTIFAAEDISVHLDVIDNTNKIILFVFPFSILIFGVTALFLAKLSLKPLKDFSSEVRMISHENLENKIIMKNGPQELEELTFSFNDMLDRIKHAFDMEKFIISEASHQLKTPVTVIKGYCDYILRKERNKAEYIENFQSVRRVAKNMSNLIKGILSLANLESGYLSFHNSREISLNNSLLDAIELAKYQGEQKNINFNVYLDQDKRIRADEDRLTEAFVNIIGNAFKYNHDNGSITVSTKNNQNKTEISVKDTGIGINDDEINKIFERFYRSQNVQKIEGSGLGLKIARRIIEAHSGSICVNSKPGEGTEFKIILPDKSIK
jgi:signal transduction histidine kinase